MPVPEFDFDRFRLRSFVGHLLALGEVQVHPDPVALADLSRLIDSTPKASLFKAVGPERHEVVAAVIGSRARLSAAFHVDPENLVREYARRLATPQSIVEIKSKDAPVHQVILQGDQVDLAVLPFHLQHEYDGGPYISSAIDYSVDPATGKTNVGCRRLMLRGRDTLRANLTQPSDLKQIYKECVKRGERLPVSFAIGSHPVDFVAATLRLPGDEFSLVAAMRGEPLPMVRGITNGVLAPADVEMVIEGYFDEQGYRELEGPYGEFWGFYGPVHIDPVFHATAITMRKDALHQSMLHGGRQHSRMEAGNMSALHSEALAWRALKAANIEPAAVYAVRSVVSVQHLRVALRRGVPGQARTAISALFGIHGAKHVVVVDDDVDVTSDTEAEWAMCTRFRPERDLVISSGFPAFYADPTANEEGSVTKIGFDLTAPYPEKDTVENRRPRTPLLSRAPARYRSARQALESEGCMHFLEIMESLGSVDGREIAIQLDALREEGALDRTENGQWAMKARDRS